MNITFNELRRIKDNLPEGTMHKIANQLDLSVETVRNYFGGANFVKGESVGLNIEQGPDGGIVHLEDDRIINLARQIIDEK
jgi:transcriptional antiterminator